jgi:DNA-binding HxlR family transcriptional regulator
MRWRDIGETRCSIARSLAVVGDRWTLLVLRECFLGTRRFDAFRTHLGVTRHLLANRLAKLVAHGILARVRYQERPARFEYRLTEKGRDLYTVIVGLVGWGDRWMADADGPPVRLVHRACGHRMRPALTCPDCGGPVTARDVVAELAPGLRAEESTR